MFMFKKNSCKTLALLEFLPWVCALDIAVCFDLRFFVVDILVENRLVTDRLCMVMVALILLMQTVCFAEHILLSFKSKEWGRFVPAAASRVVAVVNIYYLVVMSMSLGLFIRCAMDVSSFPAWGLYAVEAFSHIAYALTAIQVWIWSILSYKTQKKSIVWFYKHHPQREEAFIINLKQTLDTKTGVRVVSNVPECSRSVDVGDYYFTIDDNDDLVIAAKKWGEDDTTVIPKETVEYIRFTTMSGFEKKVCYSDGVWKAAS